MPTKKKPAPKKPAARKPAAKKAPAKTAAKAATKTATKANTKTAAKKAPAKKTVAKPAKFEPVQRALDLRYWRLGGHSATLQVLILARISSTKMCYNNSYKASVRPAQSSVF